MGMYKHYSGAMYEVVGLVYDARDTKKLVLYRSTSDAKIRETGESIPAGTHWVRPWSEFFDEHTPGVKRFAKIAP